MRREGCQFYETSSASKIPGSESRPRVKTKEVLLNRYEKEVDLDPRRIEWVY